MLESEHGGYFVPRFRLSLELGVPLSAGLSVDAFRPVPYLPNFRAIPVLGKPGSLLQETSILEEYTRVGLFVVTTVQT